MDDDYMGFTSTAEHNDFGFEQYEGDFSSTDSFYTGSAGANS